MNVLDKFGVAADAAPVHGKRIPKKVHNRVAHIDADFIAYQIASDTKEELSGDRPLRPIEYKLAQIEDIAGEIMDRAGASKFVLHVTPSASTKGNRAAQAVQKEYQANRLGRDKPEHLDAIRAEIARSSGYRHGIGVAHLDQEADDALVQANLGDIKNSVLCSRDKDLRMAAGWHMDMDTDELVWVEPGDFGHIDLVEKVSESGKSKTKKIVGYGPKFFWAQCLMGDTADNVAGLPEVAVYSNLRLFGGDAFNADLELFRNPETSETQKNRIKAKWVKTKKCGPAGAFELLHNVENNKAAFTRVRDLFNEVNRVAGYKFTHWKTGAEVTPTQALLGDMQLLWMRETKNENDVVRWLKTFA